MSDEFVSEVKKVKGGTSRGREVPRGPTMEEGERAETPQEKQRREADKQKFKEAPIIQKEVT